jgi:O-antigen ligase
LTSTDPAETDSAQRLPALVVWSRETTLTLTLVLSVVVLSAYSIVPLLAPFVVVASIAIHVYWHLRDGLPLPRLRDSTALKFFLPLGLWAALSVLWTINPGGYTGFISSYLIVVATVLLGLQMFKGAQADVVERLALAMVIAFLVSIAFHVFEGLTGHLIRRTIGSLLPGLRSTAMGVKVVNGWVTSVAPFVAQKGVAVLTLLLWPLLLLVHCLTRESTGWRKHATWFVFAASLLAIGISELETAKLAVPVAALAFALARWRPTWAVGLAAIGWVVSCLLVVPLAHQAANLQIHKEARLQYSARHRIIIWKQTATQIAQHPIIGRGIASTRYIDEQAQATGAPQEEGRVMHSHNVFLQTWHELGLIGALCLLLAGVPVLLWLRTCDAFVRPYAIATFVTAGLVASLSWSLIAPWYIATFGYVALTMGFAAMVHDRANTQSPIA